MWTREVTVALMRPIPPEYVGTDGRGHDAIPWYMVVAELNRIFGPWAWSHQVISTEVREQTERKNTVVTVSAIVELRVQNSGVEVTHRAVGVDTNFGASDQALRVAEMGAEHIALKRAAVKLGPAFGLHLYDGGGRGSKVPYPWNAKPVWSEAMSASSNPAPAPASEEHQVEPEPEPRPEPAVTAPAPEPRPEPAPVPEPNWRPQGDAPPPAVAEDSSEAWKRANRKLHAALGELSKAKGWDSEYKSKVCDLIHWAACQAQHADSLTEVSPDYLDHWAGRFSGLVKAGKHDVIMGKLKTWANERKNQ